MKNIILSPSLMCGNLFNLEEDLRILQQYPFDYLHLDIMDGHFVPNITFGFDLVNKIGNYTSTARDIHLMVNYPDAAVKELDLNRKDLVTFHIESMNDPVKTIQNIRSQGAKVGIAISPDTHIKTIYPFLAVIDHVLVMTVHPGFSGSPFVESSYDRVQDLSEAVAKNHYDVTIGVDGAIGFEQISRFKDMGVRLFVLGTTELFRGDLMKQAAAVTALNNVPELLQTA